MAKKPELMAEVLADLTRQLQWVGPTGRTQAHIVIIREHAQFILDCLSLLAADWPEARK